MGIWRKRAPNVGIKVPGWDEPCVDVLRLPSMLMETGEGYFRIPADGALGKAGAKLYELYKSYLPKEKATITMSDGSKHQTETWKPDENLLVGKLFGENYDSNMRSAFAQCLMVIGVNSAEVFAIGERVHAEYLRGEAERAAALAEAKVKLQQRYDGSLGWFVKGKVLEALEHLLVLMTVRLGRAPDICTITGAPHYLAVALEDIETAAGRTLPRGDQLPDYVTVTAGGGHYMTLNELALFGYAELRDWYFEDEDNERVSELHAGITHLQFEMLDSTAEGRRVLDKLTDGLFGG